MLDVFLCCAPADRDVAAAVADRLERNVEAVVSVDDAPESVTERWQGGLNSHAILLLLSPEAVPARASRDEWGELLDHTGDLPAIGAVLVRDCACPPLLRRKHFFTWEGGGREALRAIEAWLLELHELPAERSFEPARLPWFEGRREDLDWLWETLVDRAGAAVVAGPAGSGKTSLAQEFARQASAHFRDTLWIPCADRSGCAIASDLADALGADYSAGGHRVLIVLDDVSGPVTIPEGRASVLLTTRSSEDHAPPATRVLRLEGVPRSPVQIPTDEAAERLWRAMAVCSPGGFPVDLATAIAKLQPEEVSGACRRLIEAGVADPFDAAGASLRLSAAAIIAAGGSIDLERRRHAEAVHAAIAQWNARPDVARRHMPELGRAFRWAAGADWPLAVVLARRGFTFLQHRGRTEEAEELMVSLRDAADAGGDWEVSDDCARELSWIRGVPYRGPDRAPGLGEQLGLDFGD